MLKQKNLFRLLGFFVLLFILAQADITSFGSALRNSSLWLVATAIVLNVPVVQIKAKRWQWLLKSQKIPYGTAPSFLAYFGSIFIGLLTPGRLGEFVKTFHVSRDCGVPAARAFTSVLVDRLFDLYALVFVGGVALLSLGIAGVPALLASTLFVGVGLVLPPALLLNKRAFRRAESLASHFGKIGRAAFRPEGFLVQIRDGLSTLRVGWIVLAGVLTIAAYSIFYFQAYLLVQALHLEASFLDVSYALALGSLITLVPISISGIGTREAGMIAFLGTKGMSSDAALSFSFLVFINFYIGTGILGALAWMIKPVSFKDIQKKAHA